MKNMLFKKRCGAAELTQELQVAGFNIIGVSTCKDDTNVHLDDTETKDPTPIVEAHIAPPEEPLEQPQTDQRITDLELVLADLLAAQVPA